jgi:hypothetical protein
VLETVAWPGVVVVLGFGFMLLFRRPITAVLERTRRVGKGGLETFESPQLPAPTDKPDPLAEFMGSFDNPLLREQEAVILADIKARWLADPYVAQKALVRSLAGTQILLLFERIQSLIWASQVALLTYLNSRPTAAPLNEVRRFYDDAAQKYPDLYHGYSFDSWVTFLASWMLIERHGEFVSLSKAGREFLKWRIEIGRAGPFHG